jgi:SAM-dependent methyltransferase
MPQLIKDILLIFIFILVMLMLATMLINLFFTKAPYVPSSKKILDRLLAELKLKPDQIVYDLGCGDGRFLIRSEKKFGIKGIGYELAPLPFVLAKILQFFSRSKSRIILGNFFKANLRDADVIFCYLFPEIVSKVYQKAKQECRPGTVLISNTFSAQDIKPTKVLYDQNQKPQIYFYQI